MTATAETVYRVTTAEAAKLFGIPERTIRRWWAEGRLTDPERHGRALLWDVAQLAELAEWRHERNPH